MGWQVLWKDQGAQTTLVCHAKGPGLKTSLPAWWVPAAGRAGCAGVGAGDRGPWWELCLSQLVNCLCTCTKIKIVVSLLIWGSLCAFAVCMYLEGNCRQVPAKYIPRNIFETVIHRHWILRLFNLSPTLFLSLSPHLPLSGLVFVEKRVWLFTAVWRISISLHWSIFHSLLNYNSCIGNFWISRWLW